MSRNLKKRQHNVYRNSIYYHKWIAYLEKICLTRIEWIGLPDSVDSRWMERVLMRNGKAVFFNAAPEGEEELFMATKVATQDSPDVYDNYHKFLSLGTNWSMNLPEGEGVLIWDNLTRRPYLNTIMQYAEDLAEIDSLMSHTRKQQRQALLLTGPSHAIKELRRLKEDLASGESIFVADETVAGNIGVSRVDLTSPYLVSEINNDKQYILNEIYQNLGIYNIQREKKQYLNTEETSVDIDAISRIREDLLFARDQACAQINDKYGLDVRVRWRTGAMEDILSVDEGGHPGEESPDKPEGAEENE